MKWVIITVLLAFGAYGMVHSGLSAQLSLFSAIAIILFAIPTLIATDAKAKKRFIMIGLFALFIETIGILTGFPYSAFAYGEGIGSKLGVVPWTVFFAFTPLVFGAYALVRRTSHPVIYSALLLVIFDLVLDPAAVALGMWSWQIQGAYYGVPLQNFIGWFFTGAIASAMLIGIRPNRYWVTSTLLIMLYWTFASIFLGLLVPSLIGIAIVAFIVWSDAREDR